MPDWNRIAKKQQKSRDNMYSPADLEEDRYFQRRSEERKKFKLLLLECLKDDKEFRNQVKKLLD